MSDLIERQAALNVLAGMIDRFERILADIRETKVDDSVCGMCEYDGAYIGQSGDWCNECPGFDKDNCFKLSDRCRKRWMGDITLPSAQPQRWIPCGKCIHADGRHRWCKVLDRSINEDYFCYWAEPWKEGGAE